MLNTQQVEAYERDGLLTAIRVMTDEQVSRYRAEFDALEAEHGREHAANKLVDLHFEHPFVWEIATNPKILDCVTALLGDDVFLLATHFFCKYGPDDAFVAWHQDLRYWGLEPPIEMTAWYAIDDSTRENGCMRVIPGLHRDRLLEHGKSQEQGNLLSINQEAEVSEEQEQLAVDCVLRAGEISLHDGMLIHGSLPNRTNKRRCGLTIRYLPTHVRPVEDGPVGMAQRWRPILVRGTDQHGYFKPTDPPFALNPS